jgi:hypothetical protein
MTDDKKRLFGLGKEDAAEVLVDIVQMDQPHFTPSRNRRYSLLSHGIQIDTDTELPEPGLLFLGLLDEQICHMLVELCVGDVLRDRGGSSDQLVDDRLTPGGHGR